MNEMSAFNAPGLRRFAARGLPVALLAACLVIGAVRSLYVLEDFELGWLSHDGATGRAVTEPGLHLKWPWQSLRRFARHRQWREINPGRQTTSDGIWIDFAVTAVWRVSPKGLPARGRFMALDAELAREIETLISRRLLEEVSEKPLAELLPVAAAIQTQPDGRNPANRSDAWLEAVRVQVGPRMLRDYGLELLELAVTRLTLPESSRTQLRRVEREMKAGDREAAAAGHRREALAEMAQIRAEAEQRARRIRQQARAEAQQIRRQAESEAIRIRAAARPAHIEVRVLLESADALRAAMDAETTLVLEGGHEFFRLLDPASESRPAGQPAGPIR